MIARITSYFFCTEADLWDKLTRPEYLQRVSSPVLKFMPDEDDLFEGNWTAGREYNLSLYLFNFLPLGNHRIKLVKIDKETKTILSEETGLLARTWNHKISFQQCGEKRIKYTDTVEINAGLLTPLIWSFAQLFYRHRQRRWKDLLE